MLNPSKKHNTPLKVGENQPKNKQLSLFDMLDTEALNKTEHTEKVSQQTQKASSKSEPKEKQSSQAKKESEAKNSTVQLKGATFKIQPFEEPQLTDQVEC